MDPQPAAWGVDRAIRAIALLVACAAAVYLLLAVYVGWHDLACAIGRLGAAALLGGLVLSSLNYLLRFGRWNDLLLRMGQRLPVADNVRVYLGGLALTATPGKVGETIRSALLLRWGVPVGASLAAFFVDRLTDLIGVLLLAAATGGGPIWWALTALALGIAVALRVVFSAQWSERVARRLEQDPRLTKLVLLLRSGMVQYVTLWRGVRVISYVGIAILAYGLQAVVFAVYVERLWRGADWVASLHIFATATLVGAASMIPGGLGAMELALIAQLSVAGMPLMSATAAALAVRTVTLWFAILLGLVCLLWYRRRDTVVLHP